KKKNPQADRNSDLATERPVLDGGELCQNFSRAGNPDTIKNHIVHDDTVPEFLCLQKKFGQDKSQLMLNAQQVIPKTEHRPRLPRLSRLAGFLSHHCRTSKASRKALPKTMKARTRIIMHKPGRRERCASPVM